MSLFLSRGGREGAVGDTDTPCVGGRTEAASLPAQARWSGPDWEETTHHLRLRKLRSTSDTTVCGLARS